MQASGKGVRIALWVAILRLLLAGLVGLLVVEVKRSGQVDFVFEVNAKSEFGGFRILANIRETEAALF